MSLNGKQDHFEMADLVAFGGFCGLKSKKAEGVVREMHAHVENWLSFADQANSCRSFGPLARRRPSAVTISAIKFGRSGVIWMEAVRITLQKLPDYAGLESPREWRKAIFRKVPTFNPC